MHTGRRRFYNHFCSLLNLSLFILHYLHFFSTHSCLRLCLKFRFFNHHSAETILSYQQPSWFLLNPGNPFHSSPHLVSWHNLLHWLQWLYSFPYSPPGYFFTVSFMEKLCNIVHGIKYVFNCFAEWMTEYINEWANKIKCPPLLTN